MSTITASVSDNKVTILVSGLATSGQTKLDLIAVTANARRFVTSTISAGTGAAVLVDYFPPLNQPIRYVVESDRATFDKQLDAITVRSDTGFLRSSIEPSKMLRVDSYARDGVLGVVFGSFKETGGKAAGEKLRVLGARLPVFLSAGVTEYDKHTLMFIARGEAMIQAVQDLFDTSPLLCLQALPGWGLVSPVTHFPLDYDMIALNTRNISYGVKYTLEVCAVRPPVKLFVFNITIEYVDGEAAKNSLLIQDVDSNAGGATIAEVDANPDILLGAGSSA